MPGESRPVQHLSSVFKLFKPSYSSKSSEATTTAITTDVVVAKDLRVNTNATIKGDLILTSGNIEATQTNSAGKQLYSFTKYVDITTAATASDNVAIVGTGNIVQPAGTAIKSIKIKNFGASAITIPGTSEDAGITLQLGISGNTDSIAGPVTASATTGNIIDAATADDNQNWPAGGFGVLYSNFLLTPAGTNSFIYLNSALDAVAMTTLSTTQSYSSAERTILATITSLTTNQTNAPISAANWRIIIEFEYL